MNRIGSMGLLAALACLGPGCASNAANRVTIEPEGAPLVTVVNSGLQGDCEVITSRAFYEQEILVGVVEMQGHVDEKQTLEGRFTWYDAGGVQQEENAWEVLFINALEEKQVQGRSNGPGAVRGRFELRRFSGRTDGDR